jgi:hypothetical protein
VKLWHGALTFVNPLVLLNTDKTKNNDGSQQALGPGASPTTASHTGHSVRYFIVAVRDSESLRRALGHGSSERCPSLIVTSYISIGCVDVADGDSSWQRQQRTGFYSSVRRDTHRVSCGLNEQQAHVQFR